MFPVSGLQSKYLTFEDLRKSMGDSASLTQEVTVVVDAYVSKINDGTITCILRGSKRTELGDELVELRRKTVEAFEGETENVKDRFRAISVEKYRRQYLGDPRLDGHFVKFIKVPGRKDKVECVLMRVLPEDEWEVDLRVSLGLIVSDLPPISSDY